MHYVTFNYQVISYLFKNYKILLSGTQGQADTRGTQDYAVPGSLLQSKVDFQISQKLKAEVQKRQAKTQEPGNDKLGSYTRNQSDKNAGTLLTRKTRRTGNEGLNTQEGGETTRHS